MRNVLITGGAGFIGSNLAHKLYAQGYTITVLDCLSSQIHGIDSETSPLYNSIRDCTNFIKGSVNSKEDLLKALSDNEIVVHLAAETGTGQSMYQSEKYSMTNSTGTALLLDVLTNHKHCVKKILLASSRAVYGEGKYLTQEGQTIYPYSRSSVDLDKGYFEVKYPGYENTLTCVPTDEDSKLYPTSVYGITKLNQEQLISTVCMAIKLPFTIFRFQNVYGPGQSLSNPYTGILSVFSTQIKNNNPINIFEDGKESRDFVFIDDVVNAIMLGIENPNADNEVFNVGTGTPTDVYTVAKTLVKYYNQTVPINITGNYRLGDIRHNYADLSKIKKLLNYSAQFSFERGISQFAAWVNNQKIHHDKLEESIQEMKLKGLFK